MVPNRPNTVKSCSGTFTMSADHSTLTAAVSQPAAATNGKPAKPSPDFPLFPHATKRWAKKIKGRMHYFGPWDDPQGALENYQQQAEALHAGRRPGGEEEEEGELTIRVLCNAWLRAKQDKVDSKELAPTS